MIVYLHISIRTVCSWTLKHLKAFLAGWKHIISEGSLLGKSNQWVSPWFFSCHENMVNGSVYQSLMGCDVYFYLPIRDGHGASGKIGDGVWHCVFHITKHGHHRKYKTTRGALTETLIKYKQTSKNIWKTWTHSKNRETQSLFMAILEAAMMITVQHRMVMLPFLGNWVVHPGRISKIVTVRKANMASW